MATVADILGPAFADAGIVGSGQTPSGDDTDTALTTLNQMLGIWQVSAFPSLILPEYTSAGDDLGLPREFEAPMRYNLAVNLCAAFSTPLRPDVKQLATTTLRTLKRLYLSIPQLSIPVDLLPRRRYDVVTGTWLVLYP
jgi:hypothetical protein